MPGTCLHRYTTRRPLNDLSAFSLSTHQESMVFILARITVFDTRVNRLFVRTLPLLVRSCLPPLCLSKPNCLFECIRRYDNFLLLQTTSKLGVRREFIFGEGYNFVVSNIPQVLLLVEVEGSVKTLKFAGLSATHTRARGDHYPGSWITSFTDPSRIFWAGWRH